MKKLAPFFVALLLGINCFSQTVLTAEGAAIIAKKKAATGGGGAPCVASYANTGGSGDRTPATGDGSVTVTDSGISGVGDSEKLVNGVKTPEGNFFNNVACSGIWIRFDFGHAVFINEAKFYQENTTAQGTWKWQGSSDGSSFTDIGSSFALGGVATQTITTMSANTTSYRYYRILGVSGSTSSSPWIYEFEFKICTP